MTTNPQLDLAFDFVTLTDRNIFLTGKAGTGKTTFLHNLKRSTSKRMAIVAPTGVAAINAGGVTIHSFFQMPFGPYVPENSSPSENARFQKKFSRDKINLIRSLDLLVIDEISMVRADTLDCIDEVLRRYKNRNKPFGGVQLLMIGDLHQLSPVVKDDDWKILKDYYQNLFFFSSTALKKTQPISIELKHIYRQSDTFFIDLLNRVRQNQIDAGTLDLLNQRYIPDFKPAENEGYITLTTHNHTAQKINELKLKEINSKTFTFSATVLDDFPEYSYPTVAELELKIGAQVMFVKNDPSRERLFYNGKIGVITKIENEIIYVQCPGEPLELRVEPLEWTNIKYNLNKESKEVDEQIIGSFTQYPLKLAWAITIHKSQGLTFERAIIDANAAFAHGQVYVALSRCKSFEGMVLRSQISFNSVKTDGTVSEYTKKAEENSPGEEQLKASKISFQQSLLYDLFDFSNLKSSFFALQKIVQEHYNTLVALSYDEFINLKESLEKEIYEVADTFKKHLDFHLQSENLPENNNELQARIKKACNYFIGKTDSLYNQKLNALNFETDNKVVKTSLGEALENLSKEIFIKTAGMKLCLNGFSTLKYLQTIANAEIDFASSKTKVSGIKTSTVDTHPELYNRLKAWRDNLAEERNQPVYIILAQKSLLEIVKKLPASLQELGTIKGIGKIKVKQFGSQIMGLIDAYCKENNISRKQSEISLKPEKVKADTKKVSFDLYKSGKTISEIAAERALTTGTIEGHLGHFITTGEINVFDLVPKLKVAKIMAYIVQHPKSTSNETKIALGETVSYGDLKAVMNHLEYINAEID
ncbi:MAG: HRDC domain-containing protein [Daejeonella sp.]